jgi:hypothetical protein
MPPELTFKQRLFIEAYIGEANGNATEAARIAGYRWPEKVAHRLVGKSGIQARIGQRVASAAMPANEVLARLSDQASADIGEFLDIDASGGWRLNLRKPGRRTHLIKRIRRTREGADIEIRDSFPALVKLGEYHGLWNQTPAPTIDLEAIRDRLKALRDARAADPVKAEEIGGDRPDVGGGRPGQDRA